MKAHIVANIFQQYFLIKACVLIFRHNTTARLIEYSMI